MSVCKSFWVFLWLRTNPMNQPGQRHLQRFVSVILLGVSFVLVFLGLQLASYSASARQASAIGPGSPVTFSAVILLQNSTATHTATHTATQTATASWTATFTTTQTVTGTPTPTGSITLSLTLTATGTGTSTPTSPTTFTAQPTASATIPAPLDATPVVAETGVITATTTLAPLPAITYQFPAVTATDNLLAMEHQPDAPAISKRGAESWAWERLARFWPLGLLLLIWLGLAVWFVLSQRY